LLAKEGIIVQVDTRRRPASFLAGFGPNVDQIYEGEMNAIEVRCPELSSMDVTCAGKNAINSRLKLPTVSIDNQSRRALRCSLVLKARMLISWFIMRDVRLGHRHCSLTKNAIK